MKYVLMIVLFFLGLNLFGCSKNNLNQVLDSDTTITLTESSNELQPTNTISEEKIPKPTEDDDLSKYQLCNLNLSCTKKEAIEELGDCLPTYYAYNGGAGSWALLWTTLTYDGVKIVTTRPLEVCETDKEGEDIITEIDISTPEFTTSLGIKVGDTIDKVIETYDMEGFYVLDDYSIVHNNCCYMFSERLYHEGRFSDCEYVWTYGEFEKIAYIYWFDESGEISYRPSLIFLFHDDMVTHIILYNWIFQVAS